MFDSYVFAPPLYQKEVLTGYWTEPYVDKIRDAIADAFTGDPADQERREQLAAEGAGVWVLNGTDQANRGSRIAGFLEFHGLSASAPRPKPEGAVPDDTVIRVYDDPAKFPLTIAYLEEVFGVTVERATDAEVRTDIVITIGNDTPDLEPPPSS